jgi:CRISPR-associated protein Cas5t
MLALYVEAPFAAFRTFTAGWYRPTATLLTPSAAYGLLLNIAGVESRLREENESHGGKVPASLLKRGLPPVQVAIGIPEFRLRPRGREVVPLAELFPRQQTVFQQLHNYPVGTSGAERAESTKGNKYNITPVRREYLSEVRAVIAVRGNDSLADRIRQGIAGELAGERYGVPFLGDNAFLIDRLQLVDDLRSVRWFERIDSHGSNGIRERTTRLTVLIDRADLSRTTSALYAPQPEATDPEPPQLAWTDIHPPPEETQPPPARKPNRRKRR